ncbi:unnamed protein product [Camellia sinensis]
MAALVHSLLSATTTCINTSTIALINPYSSSSSSSSAFPLHQLRLIPSINHNTRTTTLNMSLPTSQNPVMPASQQKITIPNNFGEKLVGILHETGSVEIVILCHGFRSAKEQDVMVNVAVALEKEGITAFRFDFAGNGYMHSHIIDKQGKCFLAINHRKPNLTIDRLQRESEGSFQYGNYWREAEDLRAVIQHFNGASRVTSAILGHSKGVLNKKFQKASFLRSHIFQLERGNVVLLYASKYHDIHTVVNVSGRYNLEKGIEERLGKDFIERTKKEGYLDVENKKGEVLFRVTEESLMDRLNTKMHDACVQIDKNCRVLTVHGSADEIIPVEDALEFAKIIPNHKLHIIEEANHVYTKHQAELISVVLPFIKGCLTKRSDDIERDG